MPVDRETLTHQLLPESAEYNLISVQQLQALLNDVRGSTIITLSALTVPEYRKTGCPFKNNIQKLARVNGFLNFDYEGAVNRQREREEKTADFEALPRQWGTRLTSSPFVSHVLKSGEHKLYLRFKVQRSLGHIYCTLDGTPLAHDEVKPFLPPPKKTRQGVDKEVIERDYAVNNLLTVHFNKQGYKVAC